MIPVGSCLEPEQYNLLRALSVKRGVSMSALLRVLLRQELEMALESGEITTEVAW